MQYRATGCRLLRPSGCASGRSLRGVLCLLLLPCATFEQRVVLPSLACALTRVLLLGAFFLCYGACWLLPSGRLSPLQQPLHSCLCDRTETVLCVCTCGGSSCSSAAAAE